MKTKKIVMAALFAALICVLTMVVKIPSPFKGYMNLGDCAVLLAGFILPPSYGFLAAGVGSALADVFSGYIVYVPITFLIKGLMACVMYYGLKIFNKRTKKLISKIICGGIAELIMASGYFLFEGFLYGFIPSSANIPFNLMQGFLGLLLGVVLITLFEKHKIIK